MFFDAEKQAWGMAQWKQQGRQKKDALERPKGQEKDIPGQEGKKMTFFKGPVKL